MINRDNKIIAPSGQIVILPGDNLSILVDVEKINATVNEIIRMFENKKESS